MEPRSTLSCRPAVPRSIFGAFRTGMTRIGKAAQVLLPSLTLTVTVTVRAAIASEPVSFSREVRPILSEHCFACHGPDERTRKADLRLDLPDDARRALKSGHRAVVPGDPDGSALVSRIESSDPDDVMPPPVTKKPLSAAKREILRRWVAEGAVFEGHWAYLPPTRSKLPAVTAANWPRNGVDHFILARLEREGLSPSPEASREKLIRRVSLDLTGLPPTVEELDAFLGDPDPAAYETVVDRLLSSKHYGERMAQMWLDLARYGETQGYHHDRHRDMWRWRDWVIRAFNENIPYDRFTTEQLAGDLLPDPTRDQLVATGFHRNEMTTSEGGALPEEYAVKYVVGRVDTTARVWLGSSMACAECHDHKYDPISQRDFYRFFAFFNQVPENGLDAEELNPVPRITLELEADRRRLEQLETEVRALEAAAHLTLDAPQATWDGAQKEWETRLRVLHGDAWTFLRLASARFTARAALEQRADQSIAFDAATTTGMTYELDFESPEPEATGIRLEVLPAARTSEIMISEMRFTARALRPEAAKAATDTPRLGAWQVLGPFPAGSAKEAFDRAYGPESSHDLGATYLDGRLRWHRFAGPAAAEDELAWPGPAGSVAHYATRSLTVSNAQVRELSLAGRSALQVWLNGRRLHARGEPRPAGAEPDRVRLRLRPGENHLLIKVSGEIGPEPLVARLAAEPLFEVPVEVGTMAIDGSRARPGPRELADGDPRTGWTVGRSNETARAWIATREAFGFPGGTELQVRLDFAPTAGSAEPPRIRLSASRSDAVVSFVELPDEVRTALSFASPDESDTRRGTVRHHYRRRHVTEVQTAESLLAAKRKERDDFRNGWPTAMVMRDSEKGRETRLLVRGRYDEPGPKVELGVPEQIFPWQADLPKNRLGLARWLLDPRHPLTSRVAVNQYWQKYFGTGLVKTAEEFGSQGEWPSHPELLDWLAVEFVRSGWNVKAMQRLIVLSATYRQDSAASPALLERDPENRLLARGPRFRLDAENVRDTALSIAGLLDPTLGGPSVFPYQPPGLWGQVSFEGTRDYVQSQGSDNYRRGLYTYWRRSIPYASFTIFDAPTRETCTVRRPRTNTPLQALNLMNDPVYVEAARAFGHRILVHGGRTLDDRITYATKVALGRRPSERERELLVRAVNRERANFAADREAANRLIHVGASRPPVDLDIVELAAWTVVGSTLLNLDETITKG